MKLVPVAWTGRDLGRSSRPDSYNWVINVGVTAASACRAKRIRWLVMEFFIGLHGRNVHETFCAETETRRCSLRDGVRDVWWNSLKMTKFYRPYGSTNLHHGKRFLLWVLAGLRDENRHSNRSSITVCVRCCCGFLVGSKFQPTAAKRNFEDDMRRLGFTSCL